MAEHRPSSAARPQVFAWLVHLFTASGVILAFLALLAIEREAWAEALLWLFAALAVDGLDGSLARAANVRERLPKIDGQALDLVIDYLTFVFIPALFLWRGGYFPPPLALPLCAAILVSSLYTFARRDMKTEDGYFRGFPALWNVVAFYFFVGGPAQPIGAAVAVSLVAMTFAPVHVVHPFRVRDYGRGLPVLAILWSLATAALLLPLGDALHSALMLASLASAGLLIVLGLVRTIRGPRPAAQ